MRDEDATAARPSSGATERASYQPSAAELSRLRHDLRTPLNAIVGYSEMWLEEGIPAESGEVVSGLERIRAFGQQMLGQINDRVVIDGSQRSDLPALALLLRSTVQDLVPIADVLLAEVGETEGLQDDLAKIRAAALHLLELADEAAQGALPEVVRRIPAAPHRGTAPLGQEQWLTGRVLVVDDDDLNRDLLLRRLEKEGHCPVGVPGGPEALELLGRESFDLILLDVTMPTMNGYEVLTRLKSDPDLRDLPVLMISASDEIDSAAHCIKVGAEDYLSKPFNPVLLRARIGACLEKRRLREREAAYLQRVEAERDRADSLLHVILPEEIAAELKRTKKVLPRRYENVAILFSDIVGFTPWCESREPEEILGVLQTLTVEFEEIALQHGLEKIKTIGDAFMAAGGLLKATANPVLDCVRGGLAMAEAAERVLGGRKVRIGIHVGPVVAGVVGQRTYLFDVWGDTVNLAARVESTGLPGTVSVTHEAWQTIADQCRGESRGLIEIKGKGPLEIFRVTAIDA